MLITQLGVVFNPWTSLACLRRERFLFKPTAPPPFFLLSTDSTSMYVFRDSSQSLVGDVFSGYDAMVWKKRFPAYALIRATKLMHSESFLETRCNQL